MQNMADEKLDMASKLEEGLLKFQADLEVLEISCVPHFFRETEAIRTSTKQARGIKNLVDKGLDKTLRARH